MRKFTTRIAPSPTGMFHLGTARTAYFNWLAAKATGGTMILRIDDTDANRNDDNAVKLIYDTMDWLGLDYGPTFKQSTHAKRYRVAADVLISKDRAYMDGDAVRLKLGDLPPTWDDKIAGTVVINDNDKKLIDGLVLMKSDGTPTYNFATVVDDMTYGVNLIIRGTDHTSNTPKQIAIAWALRDFFGLDAGYTYVNNITYAHVGLITLNKKKISKRDGAASLLDYRDKGIKPDAMLNFMLRLGWSPSDPNFDKKHSLITKDMAVDMFFKDGSMRNSPAGMDLNKLDWYNRRY